MIENAESFPPIVGSHVHTLILGTVPGQASLEAAQYYAHARNAFWPIMLAIVNKQLPSYDHAKTFDYATRCQLIASNGFAIWDVLASCTRPGSLDSNIVKSTEQPNDIAGLVAKHKELRLIVCNGRTSEKLFKRHIIKTLPRPIYAPTTNADEPANSIRLLSLPSTSPAMASLTLADKYQVWADGLLG